MDDSLIEEALAAWFHPLSAPDGADYRRDMRRVIDVLTKPYIDADGVTWNALTAEQHSKMASDDLYIETGHGVEPLTQKAMREHLNELQTEFMKTGRFQPYWPGQGTGEAIDRNAKGE